MEVFNFRRFKINPVIRAFIIADLALLSGWGLVDPIFAVFVKDRIEGATVVTIGIAAAIYWIVKSLLQIPVATMLDRIRGERDDYMILILGLALSGVSGFGFVLVDQIWQLYLVRVIQALAFALYIPAWYSIFSRHLDKDHRSFEFSLDSTVTGLMAGMAGLLSGFLVQWFGFVIVFILAAIASLASAGIILMVPEIIYPHHRRADHVVGDHTPKGINK